MRPVSVAILDCLVGDEPGVPATPKPLGCRFPAVDVRLVLIANPDGPPLQRGSPAGREVEDKLVTVIEKSRTVDGLVVTHGQIALETRPRSHEFAVDHNRLDPVDGVLQRQALTRLRHDIKGGPGFGGLGADVQKQRPVWGEDAPCRAQPVARPREVLIAGERIVIRTVGDAQVVGR